LLQEKRKEQEVFVSPKKKIQQGYLLVVAAILVVVVGFIAAVIAYMYLRATKSSANLTQSNQAFYIATSGIEIAKRDMIANGVVCETINGAAKYTNAAFPPDAATPIGYFTVVGTARDASSQLSAGISAASTSIPLVSVAGFSSPSGMALIGDEFISYYGIQGTTLQNVLRGASGTTAIAHSSGIAVNQNSCVLTSSGMVPTIDNPEGKRVLQVQLIRRGRGYLAPGKSLPNSILPSVILGGSTSSFTDHNSGNHGITNDNSDGIGCAVATAGTYNPPTKVDYQCTTSSGAGTVWSNNYNSPAPAIDTANFYSYFFDKSISNMEGSGYLAATVDNINDVATPGNPAYGNNVVWINGDTSVAKDTLLTTTTSVTTLIVNGDLNITGGSGTGNVIGSPDYPVKVIVTGDFTVSKKTTIYGFLYIMGNANLQNNLTLNGAIASVGNVTFSGNCVINFTSDMANNLAGSPPQAGQSSPEIYN